MDKKISKSLIRLSVNENGIGCSPLVEEAIKKYHNPIVKKYSGGHFFSSGIEKELAQEFIDNIK